VSHIEALRFEDNARLFESSPSVHPVKR
jgi:hypothetical protein